MSYTIRKRGLRGVSAIIIIRSDISIYFNLSKPKESTNPIWSEKNNKISRKTYKKAYLAVPANIMEGETHDRLVTEFLLRRTHIGGEVTRNSWVYWVTVKKSDCQNCLKFLRASSPKNFGQDAHCF